MKVQFQVGVELLQSPQYPRQGPLSLAILGASGTQGTSRGREVPLVVIASPKTSGMIDGSTSLTGPS
jgi:hypothetical protein